MSTSDWFDSIERERQRGANALDTAGFGPLLTPSRVVLSVPGLRLRCYGAGTRRRPPLLTLYRPWSALAAPARCGCPTCAMPAWPRLFDWLDRLAGERGGMRGGIRANPHFVQSSII